MKILNAGSIESLTNRNKESPGSLTSLNKESPGSTISLNKKNGEINKSLESIAIVNEHQSS